MSKQYRGLGGVVGGTLGALTLAVACGNGFSGNEDCKANRTCAATGGDSASEAGTTGVHEASGDNASGAGGAGGLEQVDGGAAGTAGTAGTAGAAGASDGACHLDADCSNGDPSDGKELCNQGVCAAGNPPPTIVKVTPDDASVDVEPDVSVVIEFSEPLDPKTVTSTTIRVLDGATEVPGTVAYPDGKVTFTPASPLALLGSYTVSVTTGVEDEQGAALVSEYSSEFSIRDGAWTTIDAVKDRLYAISDALPISATGSVLLAWSGTGPDYCPVSARWFLRGAPVTPAKSFPVAEQYNCNGVAAGANAAGVGAVTWEEPDANNGSDVQQYRAGAWQPNPSRVSKNYLSGNNTLAVAPNGVVTFFEHSGVETQAWVTDASGKWPTAGATISSGSSQSRTSAVFDATGNGLAVWRAKDPAANQLERIVASRFASASGKWAVASDLPGSASAATTPGSHERGVPVVAMDSNGGAMALWVNASSGSKLMASRFVQPTGWEQPESISGGLEVEPLEYVPGLAFDGTAFVAAWTARDGGSPYAYTARYDLKTGWGTYEKQQTSAADGVSASRMPGLASDGRGNLLLLFATGTAPTFTIVSQRYAGGAWSAIKPIPSGTIADQNFEVRDTPLTLSMSANGLAALAWIDWDDNGYHSAIHLASFY